MVEVEKLTEYIQTRLNSSLKGLNNPLLNNVEFIIFTDTGKLMQDVRRQNSNEVIEYINGVVNVGTSDKYVLSNGIEFTSLPLRLELLVRLENDEFNGGVLEEDLESGEISVSQEFIGNSEKLSAVRKVLDGAFESQQVIETLSDTNGKQYMTSIVAQVSQGELRDERSIVGYSYSFYMSFFFNFVENGLNSQSGKFVLDGVEIPYTQSSLTKIKNLDQNLFSSAKGQIVGVPTFTQSSFTFDVPALSDSEPTKIFLSELIKNNDINTFHILSISLGEEETSLLVNISEIVGSLSGVQNVGLKITFTLAPEIYTLLSTSGWYTYRSTSILLNSISLKVGAVFVPQPKYLLNSIVSNKEGESVIVSNGAYVLSKTELDYSFLERI